MYSRLGADYLVTFLGLAVGLCQAHLELLELDVNRIFTGEKIYSNGSILKAPVTKDDCVCGIGTNIIFTWNERYGRCNTLADLSIKFDEANFIREFGIDYHEKELTIIDEKALNNYLYQKEMKVFMAAGKPSRAVTTLLKGNYVVHSSDKDYIFEAITLDPSSEVECRGCMLCDPETVVCRSTVGTGNRKKLFYKVEGVGHSSLVMGTGDLADLPVNYGKFMPTARTEVAGEQLGMTYDTALRLRPGLCEHETGLERVRRFAALSVATANTVSLAIMDSAWQASLAVIDSNFNQVTYAQNALRGTLLKSIALQVAQERITEDFYVNTRYTNLAYNSLGQLLGAITEKVDSLTHFVLYKSQYDKEADIVLEEVRLEMLNRITDGDVISSKIDTKKFSAIVKHGSFYGGDLYDIDQSIWKLKCSNYSCVATGEWLHWPGPGRPTMTLVNSVLTTDFCGLMVPKDYHNTESTGANYLRSANSFTEIKRFYEAGRDPHIYIWQSVCESQLLEVPTANTFARFQDSFLEITGGSIRRTDENQLELDCTLDGSEDNLTVNILTRICNQTTTLSSMESMITELNMLNFEYRSASDAYSNAKTSDVLGIAKIMKKMGLNHWNTLADNFEDFGWLVKNAGKIKSDTLMLIIFTAIAGGLALVSFLLNCLALSKKKKDIPME